MWTMNLLKVAYTNLDTILFFILVACRCGYNFKNLQYFHKKQGDKLKSVINTPEHYQTNYFNSNYFNS